MADIGNVEASRPFDGVVHSLTLPFDYFFASFFFWLIFFPLPSNYLVNVIIKFFEIFELWSNIQISLTAKIVLYFLMLQCAYCPTRLFFSQIKGCFDCFIRTNKNPNQGIFVCSANDFLQTTFEQYLNLGLILHSTFSSLDKCSNHQVLHNSSHFVDCFVWTNNQEQARYYHASVNDIL